MWIPLLSAAAALGDQEAPTKLLKNDDGANSTVWRASQIIGQNVKNAGDESVGEIQDLLVDLKSGEIKTVIISSGGFLGIADILSSVPISALRYDIDSKNFKTKLTKNQLSKAPQFIATSWPDFSGAASIEAMRTYRDAIGGDVNAPDNSAQNEKSENRETMIPTDQGNSEKDIQITRDIRSSIVASDLSFNAKNIKIITMNEFVVLKGVVETAPEHQAILKIAKNHANASKISDQLTVNTN